MQKLSAMDLLAKSLITIDDVDKGHYVSFTIKDDFAIKVKTEEGRFLDIVYIQIIEEEQGNVTIFHSAETVSVHSVPQNDKVEMIIFKSIVV